MQTVGEIGAMRRRVAIEEVNLVADGSGGFASGWTVRAETWAALQAIGASESFEDGLVISRTTHRALIRYRDDVHPAMRVVAGSRTYEILAAVDPDDRRTRLALYLEEARS